MSSRKKTISFKHWQAIFAVAVVAAFSLTIFSFSAVMQSRADEQSARRGESNQKETAENNLRINEFAKFLPRGILRDDAGLSEPSTLFEQPAAFDELNQVQFSNPTPIQIPAGGAASPYPSNIEVSGLSGTVSSVTVRLNNFQHLFADDVDILLVGPGGQKFVIFSDVGGDGGLVDPETVTLTDSAPIRLPDDDDIATTSYKPTNIGTNDENFPAPAPAGPYSNPSDSVTFASVFGGTVPNGTWSLYVRDEFAFPPEDGGSIAGGWTLDITTATASVPGRLQFAAAAFSAGENAANAIVTVTRTNGSNGTVTVNYATADQTATGGAGCGAGNDFAATSGTLTFGEGVTTQSFAVPICADAVFEGNEFFSVALSNPTGGATLGSPAAATVTINEDDTPPGDTCADAPALALDRPVFGSLINAANNYQLNVQTETSCFVGGGNFATAAAGRDRVYSFTPNRTRNYTIRAKFADTGGDINLYLSESCPATAPGTPVAYNCRQSGGAAPVATSAANRNRSTAEASEEISCTRLNAGTTYFVTIDEDTPGTGAGDYVLEAVPCVNEVATDNNSPATASRILGNTTRGAINPANDVDFFNLGALVQGSRLFAVLDTAAASEAGGTKIADKEDFSDKSGIQEMLFGGLAFSRDSTLRATTATDTLEFDDDDNGAAFGEFGSNIAGLPLPGGNVFLRAGAFSGAAVIEPYQLTYVVRPNAAQATPEQEPNNTIATANTAPNGYFSGALATAGDTDLFAVNLQPGTLLFASLDTNPTRDNTGFDGTLELFDLNGNFITGVNGAGSFANNAPGAGTLVGESPVSPGEAIVFRVPESTRISQLGAETYYVRVAGAAAGDYLLSLAPITQISTAAQVSVGGRITTADNRGIARARVTLTDETGVERTAQTNSFGYYNFAEVAAGQTVIVGVSHKSYEFAEAARVLSISQNTTDVDFVAER